MGETIHRPVNCSTETCPHFGKCIQMPSSNYLNNEGKIDVVLPNDNNISILTPYLIAYSPVFIDNYHWMLAVATPEADTLVFMTPFYFRIIGLAGLAFFGFLIITIRISKIKGYEEGFADKTKLHTHS